MTMRVVGRLEFEEVYAVGPGTLLEFANFGGTIVLVVFSTGKRVLLAEMLIEPEGIVTFLEGAVEAEGSRSITALDVPGKDEGKRVLLANGKGESETMILRVDVAGDKVLEKLVPLAESVGDLERMAVPLEVCGDNDAKEFVVFVNRVGETEGSITTPEINKLELAGKRIVEKLVLVSFGVGISENVLIVSGTIVLMVTVVMPAVTVRLYLVVVSRGLAVRVLVCRRFC